MPTLCLFADTNLFLHYKTLDQIDWSKLGDFDHIEVVVCPPVQREIDELKGGRERRRSERARKAASIFLEIAEHGPQQQRAASPRVTLDLDVTSQPKPESTDGRREGSGRGLGSYKRDDPVLNSGRREVCRRFWGHRRRSAVAVASEMA